jgi:tetratricopeptide (TPR) repeat protein
MVTKKPAPKSTMKPKKKAPDAEVGSDAGDTSLDGKEGKSTLPFEINPDELEASLNKLKEQVVVWAKKGRYTKVRFKFRGKQLLPDIPLAAVAAVEGATFYWAGLLRMLVFNLAGRTLIEIELVNDSEKKIQAGKEALLSGDLEDALAAFEEARDMDEENPVVHLNLGIAQKLSGNHAAARVALTQAQKLDPKGPTGKEAERLLRTLKIASVKVVDAEGE